MTESALIIRVPEAENVVGEFRDKYDPSAALGVPAHITVLYPFMPPERIDGIVLDKLNRILSDIISFKFHLREVKRFPTALYAAPEPASEFVSLTNTVLGAFPEYPPYAGRHRSIVPHLSIAIGHTSEWLHIENVVASRLSSQGGIVADCSDVELIENSSGRWRTMLSFPLSSQTV